jgi:hypothetical protein
MAMSPEQMLRAKVLEQAHHYAGQPERAVVIAASFERYVICGVPIAPETAANG